MLTVNTSQLKESDKILTYSQAVSSIKTLNEQRITTILVSGSFDILQVSRLSYLRAAKTVADKLFVGLELDKTITNVKRQGRPFLTLKSRLEIVASLECVDFVFAFTEVKADYTGGESDKISVKRFSELQPTFIAMPSIDIDPYTNYERQIRAAGCNPVVIECPFVDS